MNILLKKSKYSTYTYIAREYTYSFYSNALKNTTKKVDQIPRVWYMQVGVLQRAHSSRSTQLDERQSSIYVYLYLYIIILLYGTFLKVHSKSNFEQTSIYYTYTLRII